MLSILIFLGALASMERTHAERFRNLEENKERIERQLQQELHEVRENCKTAEDRYERVSILNKNIIGIFIIC